MHNGLGDVGAWLVIYFACLPCVVYNWKTRNVKDQKYCEVTASRNLNYVLGQIVAISTFWTFLAVLCSPGLILQYIFHYDFGTSVFWGVEIGMGILVTLGFTGNYFSSREHERRARQASQSVTEGATQIMEDEALEPA